MGRLRMGLTGALAAALVALAFPALAQQNQTRTQGPNQLQQTLGVTVPESTSATIRLLNLTKGTRLAFVVQPQEPLWVLFMDEANFKRFPHGATPLMSVRAAAPLSFGVQLPADGSYYFVLDNRERATSNKVQMQLRATLPPGTKRPTESKPLLQHY